MKMIKMENPNLPYLQNSDRLEAYQAVLEGVKHMWGTLRDEEGKVVGKGLNKDKALELIEQFYPLTEKDPYFLAHFTSWLIKQGDSVPRDLQVLMVYLNSLSSANGEKFSPESDFYKPNLRVVSAAAIQKLSPILVGRVIELGGLKYGIDGELNAARHFPTTLRTAVKKYVRYREKNLVILRGIKKAGLAKKYTNIYRAMRLSPSDEAAAILRWNQKGQTIEFSDSPFNFDGLDDKQIAQKIMNDKLPVLGVVGALDRVSPVVAYALMEQATAEQAVILRSVFEDAGLLGDEEFLKVYKNKIRGAKSALDRTKLINDSATKAVKEVMKTARSESRKEQMKEIGKTFIHLDTSYSMERAIHVIRDQGSQIAEMINNPEENLAWGTFSVGGQRMELPRNPKTNQPEFTQDAFASKLYGIALGGSTDCFALYQEAREFGAEVDIFISDGGHNYDGTLPQGIVKYHEQNPDVKKPKAMLWIIVNGGQGTSTYLKEVYELAGIPVVTITPDRLSESALVAQTLGKAIKGPEVVIEEIMSTKLLELPEWYGIV